MNRPPPWNFPWFIGGQRISPVKNSSFVWKTDRASANAYPVTYTNWWPGQPDFAPDNPPESCIELVVDMDYAWNDVKCDFQFCYVCEINDL